MRAIAISISAAWLVLGCTRTDVPQRPAKSAPPSVRVVAPSAPLTSDNSVPAEQRTRVETTPTSEALGATFSPLPTFHIPPDLAIGEKVPLICFLHGFGLGSLAFEYFGVAALAREKRFAYVAPDGMKDSSGRQFWNAGKSCCNFDEIQVNDIQRLKVLVQIAVNKYPIDAKRVWIVGYSNGGFMAHRAACDLADQLTGIISVSGAAPSPEEPCHPSRALSVLHIHGDKDPMVHYTGGKVSENANLLPHPSAQQTAEGWAERFNCKRPPNIEPAIDIDSKLPGAETRVQRFSECKAGKTVELWTVGGGAHYVATERKAFDAMWGFVERNSK